MVRMLRDANLDGWTKEVREEVCNVKLAITTIQLGVSIIIIIGKGDRFLAKLLLLKYKLQFQNVYIL